MTLSSRLANAFLFALTLSYLILLGGGNYEQLNITSTITSAPPQSLAMLQGPYGFTPFRFWVTFRPVTMVLFLLALAFNWKKSASRRKLILIALGIDVLVTLATYLYFAPETGAITSVPFDTTSTDFTLQARAQLWKNLNWIRLLAFYTAAVVLLLAVNQSVEKKALD